MKFSYDEKQEELSILVESIEDLYFLSKIIEENDIVSGKTLRRFKANNDKESESGEKKAVFLDLKTKQVEFSEHANKLRVSGTILGGTPEEFVSKGAAHTIDVEVNSRIRVKKKLNEYHRQLLNDAKKAAKKAELQIVVMDDEKASFALITQKGVKFENEIDCHASKRNLEQFREAKLSFFGQILKQLEEGEKKEVQGIVVAGPGFTKDEFQKFVREKNEKILKKIKFEHASNAERSAVYELLKNGVLSKALEEQKFQAEMLKLELFKTSIAKNDGNWVYGIKEVQEAIELRAVGLLMVSDDLLRKNDAKINYLIERARRENKAEIFVFNSEDDAGMEFSQFKIAAALKFKLKY